MGKEVIPPDTESAKPHVVPGVTVESVIHLRLSPEGHCWQRWPGLSSTLLMQR